MQSQKKARLIALATRGKNDHTRTTNLGRLMIRTVIHTIFSIIAEIFKGLGKILLLIAGMFLIKKKH